MYTYISQIVKLKIPLVSDWVICVATEFRHHDLSTFPGMFGSDTASYLCDSGEGPYLVARSHCLHPAAEQESHPAYRGTRDW
jgi:hypothetical protein